MGQGAGEGSIPVGKYIIENIYGKVLPLEDGMHKEKLSKHSN